MHYWGFFQPYNRQLPPNDVRSKLNVLFLKNERGEDWYDISAMVPKNETVIVTNKYGHITNASVEADRIFPHNAHVYSLAHLSPKELVGKRIVEGRIEEGAKATRRPIRRYDARLFLLNNGLLDLVESFVQKNAAIRLWYEDSPVWDMSDSNVIAIEEFLAENGHSLKDMFAAK